MRTVLVIDDDATILELLSAYLTQQKFQVVTAPDGSSGLEAFRREPFDVVLCDLAMPGLGGLEVLAQVKSLAPLTPFVVFTGSNDVGQAVEALRRGAWDYLLKPLPSLELLPPLLDRLQERAALLREKEHYQTRLEDQIKVRTAQLVRQLKEKDLLLAEVHHRVKNNLQIILVLLDLQREHATDPAAKEALEAHQARIHALAMVQEEMYEPERATLVNAQSYAAGLIHHLLSSQRLTSQVSLHLDLDDLALTPGQAFTLGLILNELLVGLGSEGPGSDPWNLTFRLKPQGPGTVVLSVIEDRGLWARIVPHRRASSLGWELLSFLASQQGGTVEWDPHTPETLTIRWG